MIINHFNVSPRQMEELYQYSYATEVPVLPPVGEVGTQSFTDVNGKSSFFAQPNPIVNVKIVKRTNTLGVNSTTDNNGYYKCVIIDQFNSDSGNLVSEFRLDANGVVLNEGDLAQGLLFGITDTYPLLKMVSGVNGADISLIYVGTLTSNKTYIGTICANNSTLSLNSTNTCWIRPPLFNSTQTLNVGNVYYGKRTGTTIVGSRTLPLYTTDFSGTGSVNLSSTISVATRQTDSSSTSILGGSTSSLVAANQTGVYFASDPINNWTTINIAEASATQAGAMTLNTQTFLQNKFFMGVDCMLFSYTNSISSNRPTTLGGSWNVVDKSWLISPLLGNIVWTNGAKSFYISADLSTNYFSMLYGDRVSSGGIPPGVSPAVGFDCREISGVACMNADGYAISGVKGFSGTGAYTNFTISNGLIMSAS